ncbi:MAG: carboxyvinyl-carboxyphosphonate phosphorylmutase [Candidatus Abyssobacteria bacterium SURF_17]|uniref:2-methylisocitrate lyase n=1 Tax=Candidatus Abyssobacteria bacterium SURF_17 TaxID=2093361 RepID=A0A419EUN0_9BACT|nr:MAG: carboxyvinyl-carboxyphosphonate phosphorylmutase [Candidatus Abyssubacteria bacterium SURF_17]
MSNESKTNAGRKLKDSLRRKKLIVAPGAYDALTAKLVEGAGFEAAYMTGYGTAASMRGLPDIGLLTMTEMLENVRAIAGAVGIPLIADADTGYGNAINVIRTVREFEKAGAAAIHIEDQVWPKRCGHMSGKQVIPKDEMAAKIRAAVEHRSTDDFLIIARTDALAVEGWENAIERGHAYVEAGADIMFVEAPETVEQMEQIPKLFDVPCLINMAPRTPSLPVETLEKMGFAIAIYPAACLAATIRANLDSLRHLKETGQTQDFGDFLSAFMEFNQFIGVPGYNELEEKFKSQQGNE